MSVDIIILAAGQGTRMKSQLPKVLHEVAGRPMVAEVMDTVQSLNAQNTVVVIGHGADAVRDCVSAEVTFAVQSEQLGTGHAVLQAREALAHSDSDTVLVLYGDSPLITAATLSHILEEHHANNRTITLLSFMPQDPTGYGRIVRAPEGRVLAIVEQRDATEAQRQIRESNSGFMIFSAAWLWQHLPRLGRSPKGEYYLTDTTAMAVIQGRSVEAVVIDEKEVLGVNDRVQLATASQLLWQRRREQWMRAGVTMVDPASVWISAESTLGEDTVLHPNVYLRGKTTIGAGCHIGAFSLLENVTVPEGTIIAPHTHLSD